MSSAARADLPAGVRRASYAAVAALTAGDDGPVALLVPGFTGSKEDFLPVLAPLAGLGFRVVAIDQAGQYESPGPDDPAAYAIKLLAADLVGVADAIGAGPVHLVGHSFGGLVARAAVLAEHGIARSLTLLDSGPGGIRGPRRDALDALRVVFETGGQEAVWQAMAAGAGPLPPAALAFLRERFFATKPAQLLGAGQALLDEPDRVDELAEVAAGAGLALLVACGADDDAWSPAVQKAMARRLTARYRAIPGAAHSPAVEAPAATVEVLSWFWRGVEDDTFR